MSKGSNKSTARIYNKFDFWSIADCACEFCPFYSEKGRKCTLDVCCCADIKEEAVRREMAATDARVGDIFVEHTSYDGLVLGGAV